MIAILAVHVAVLGATAVLHSPVASEVWNLPAGIRHWQVGCFDLYHVNPPLVRTVAALPVVLANPKTNWSRVECRHYKRCEIVAGIDFLEVNETRVLWLYTLGRWACILFSLVGGYLSYCWARGLYGVVAGLIACALWCFCPSILGLGATILPDVPAAAIGAAAAYCIWRWLKRSQWLEAIIVGLVLGLAELCKFTLLALYPLLPLLWVIYRLPEREITTRHEWLRQGGMLASALLVSVCVVNCGYLFEDTFMPLEDFRFYSMMLSGHDSLKDIPPEGANRFAGTWLGKLPVPLPANMMQGIDTQRYDFERGLPSYLRGQWADHGWWHYYLYALAIKQPLGTWCLLVMAVGMSARKGGRRKAEGGEQGSGVRGQGTGDRRQWSVASGQWSVEKPSPLTARPLAGEDVEETLSPRTSGKGDRHLLCEAPFGPFRQKVPVPFSTSWRDEMVVLVPGLAILIFVSSQTGFSVHARYVIPVLPFFFVWMSKVGRALERREEETSGRRPVVSGQMDSSPHPLPLSLWERGVVGWLRSRRQPVVAVLVIMALTWSVGSSLAVYPHSLSYFNELAAILPTPADASYPKPPSDTQKRGIWAALALWLSAGPCNGPRHLLDSNIDWGQDLFYLKDWLAKHTDVKLDGLAYYGSYPATLMGIPETRHPPTGVEYERFDPNQHQDQLGPKPGWYALSVNYIYGRDEQYRYFLHFHPVATAGYSIYIYHITLDEANRVRRELGLPELKNKARTGEGSKRNLDN